MKKRCKSGEKLNTIQKTYAKNTKLSLLLRKENPSGVPKGFVIENRKTNC